MIVQEPCFKPKHALYKPFEDLTKILTMVFILYYIFIIWEIWHNLFKQIVKDNY
jgi:hypothetical protein